MGDEQILRLSGDGLRGPDALDDPRLDELARGELDDEALLSLLAAEQEGILPTGSVEAFSPLSSVFLSRLEARVLQEERPQVENPDTDAPSESAVVVPMNRPVRRRVLAWSIGMPLAAAAAALLVLAIWPASPSGTALPTYALEVEGGLAAMRSAASSAVSPGEPVRVGRSTILGLRLRPATKVETPVMVRAFVVDPDSAVEHVFDPVFEVSASGTVAVTATAADLHASGQGDRIVHLVIAPVGGTAAIPNHANELPSFSGPMQAFSLRIAVED